MEKGLLAVRVAGPVSVRNQERDSVMMPALGRMNVCFRWRRSKLAWQHDPPSLRLFAQMFGDVRMKGPDVPDQAVQESARLKILSREVRYERKQPVQDIGSRMIVRDLLRLLFDECLVFFFQVLCKDRHRSSRHMKGTEGPPQRLDGGDDFRVLAVPPIMKVGVGHDLDQIEESRGLFASHFTEGAIQVPANRAELLAKPALLIFAAGVQV